ncbi:MAG: Na+/glucose cotransporter [Alphaproteobacteria bacterium]|nr:Na+/glucose cotransporter [Alphaproteobacteria bacterium]
MDTGSTLAMLPLDYVEFFVFLAALCVVGIVSGRGKRGSTADYFLAGRKLPWYVVGGSYVAANVSTEHFIGLVGISYIQGAAPALAQWNTSLVEILIVFLFVPFLIRARVTTVPQYLAGRFGPGVRQAFALLTIFANITIFMAAVMYAGGLALAGFFGWPLLWCIIGTGIFAGGWAVYGGLNTVAWTGLLTAVVKIGGVGLLTILALKAMTPSGGIVDGFFSVIQHNIATTGVWRQAADAASPHLTQYGAYNRLTVFQPPDHPLIPWTGIFLSLFAVGVWYGVMNQFIVQRVLGAKDIWHARMGMLVAGYAKLLLPLIVVLPGLILFTRHPEFMLGDWKNAQHLADGGFVVLVREFLPVGLRGLLLAVLICAVQSTVSSVVNATAAILTLDVYMPLLNPGASEKQKVRFGIWASIAAILAGIAMAIYVSRQSTGIFQYMQTLNGFVAPPFAAILWVGLMWKRTNGFGAMTGIIGGFAVGALIKLAGYWAAMPGWYYAFANQAAFCLFVSCGLCVAGTLLHPALTPGVQTDPVTFWDSGDALTAGLGTRWYSSVIFWAGLLLVLTLAMMLVFSQLFFPTRVT